MWIPTSCTPSKVSVVNFGFRSLQDFLSEEGDGVAARVKYDHYEKRRKTKLKFIQEFMISLKKKSRQGGANMVSLSLLPKESVFELKKSKCN